MLYVTHDLAGSLTGCYDQEIPAEHKGIYVPCTQAQAAIWTSLMWDGSALVAKPPEPPAVTVPDTISPRQFRQSLTHFGYRDNVETTIAGSDQDTKDWYASASQFERAHPKVIAMAQSMGYTSDQLDAVWTYGASI